MCFAGDASRSNQRALSQFIHVIILFGLGNVGTFERWSFESSGVNKFNQSIFELLSGYRRNDIGNVSFPKVELEMRPKAFVEHFSLRNYP